MKLTRGGQAAGLVAIALFVSAVIFRDFFVGAVFIVLLMIVASEAAWVRIATHKPESKFVITREGAALKEHKEILYPGEKSAERVSLRKKVGGVVKLESRVGFLEIEPKVVRGTGDSRLEFKFATEYAGGYSGDKIGLTVKGPLGLFSSNCTIRFPRKYMVYPRVLRVAAATVRLLGRTEVGGTPIEMPGVGSEYYEMREYQPGDDYRSVNWKATARIGELMVMEHMKEAGRSYLLVLDARAPGFRETDALASTFLSLANSMGAAGVSFGIMVHDGKTVLDASSELDPRGSLSVALRAAVRITKLDADPELLELVPLRASTELGSAEGDTMLSALNRLNKHEMTSFLEDVNPWLWAARFVRETQTIKVLYVTGLLGDVRPVIELAWETKHYRDAEFTVANPCDIAGGRARYQKLVRAFQTAGVLYLSGEPTKVVQHLLAE